MIGGLGSVVFLEVWFVVVRCGVVIGIILGNINDELIMLVLVLVFCLCWVWCLVVFRLKVLMLVSKEVFSDVMLLMIVVLWLCLV